MAEEHTHWRQPTPTADEARKSWNELKEQLRGSILTDAVAHALVTCADTVIGILGDRITELDPGWADAGPTEGGVRLADYACGVPTGGDSTCRRVI